LETGRLEDLVGNIHDSNIVTQVTNCVVEFFQVHIVSTTESVLFKDILEPKPHDGDKVGPDIESSRTIKETCHKGKTTTELADIHFGSLESTEERSLMNHDSIPNVQEDHILCEQKCIYKMKKAYKNTRRIGLIFYSYPLLIPHMNMLVDDAILSSNYSYKDQTNDNCSEEA
jgi:hypothetical protein